jgi:DNA polymerase sigma
LNKVLHLDVACARSEGGLNEADDASHCNVIPRAQTDDTMTKDGATTISSVHSPPDKERLATLKEERNSYRDMCLTLGAENAKLRNLLASKTCAQLYHPAGIPQEIMPPYLYHNEQQMWPAYNGYPNQFSTQSIVAMSDAGVHRGDYESSAMSEDGTDVHPSVVAVGESQNIASWQARGDSVQSFGRRTSGGGTYAESDTSLEYNAPCQESHTLSGLHRVHQQDSFFGPIPLHGMQSRLSKDITRYMQALKSQLKKNEPQRLMAIKQLETSVKALWPRAQIKMYGSHVTKLCLPSSDIDFVISLPAVHKNAPATAPGDLEGRNAIVETNQKVLARRLKGESWIDQRSIKSIERTAVPVIKVSTKDSRSRVVQLDLSFDAKEHHGLEALNMIQHILEELPMVRPLVLVLKQFLLDRGLLTAYTGGLSSYCLFLMVARYCQEQAPTWNDCGSLLMGLLDFYGNFFDPRTTGISVQTRQYFFRSQEAHFAQNFEAQGWNTPHQGQFPDPTKRNSFSTKPHRFQPLHRQFSFQSNQSSTSQSQQFKSGKFDPIWVADPLNPGNNVGRNAFRIFQVQRAFSDAHRALVASLEWDINSMHEFGDDGEYPLLKCLLQNEDVFLSMEDPIHR